MADNVIEVTSLEKIGAMQDGDRLLLIRTNADASQTCYQILGSDFHGKDAYTIAQEAGYTGTREDFEAQCTKVADFAVSFNASTNSLEITK